MTLRRIVLSGVLIFSLALGGMAGAQPGLPNPTGPVSAAARTVAENNNVFALDLYTQLAKEDGNLFFSPYSISTALGMTYAGAKGKTAAEMAATLHFGPSQETLHAGMGELVKHMNAQGKDRPYHLSVANRLWGQKGYTFLPAFLNTTENNYGGGLQELDFNKQPEQSRQIINGWVEKQTNDKIKDLLQSGDIMSDTRLVLTNAIYFKAAWQKEFWDKGTQPANFTLASGETVKVPMMSKHETFKLFDGGNFQIAALPYKDHALSMLVLLPKKAGGLAEVEKALTDAKLKQWLAKMTMHQVDLKLPKFKTTSRFELKAALSALGMPTAFSGEADFSGMTTQESLKIAKVIHKAFVDVHEKGTEAAAATAIIMAPTGLPPQFPNAVFHADRPFAFLIYENQTGSILFVGRVTNPK